MGGQSSSMSGENQYGSRSYWDGRYDDPSNQEAFEWLQDYKSLKEIITQQLPNKNGRVLVVGTGRSNLAKDMNADGYADVCGIDWCDKLISRVDTPGLSFEFVNSVQEIGKPGDAKFGEGTVDYVVDKALLDSILCGVNSTQNAYMYLKAVKNVLRDGGKALIVTYGKQQKRADHIERSTLFKGRAEMLTVEKPSAAGVTPQNHGIDPNHYVWVLSK